MNLITRCPACNTLFKVVPDQLRISDGWVKCGQCNEIFDASQHLIQTVAQPEQAQNLETAPDQVVSKPDALNDESVPEELIAELPQVAGQDLVLEDLSLLEPAVQSPPSEQETPSALESSKPSDSVTFLQHDSRTTVWYQPWVRGTLMLFGIVLMLGLIGQCLYYERSRLATIHPEISSMLRSLCVPLNCSIPALQQVESMVIDSASFNKMGKDGFRLTFAVKNSASTDLAVPDIELTLTDSSDQPLFRRVVTAAELGAVHPSLQAGAEWPVSVALRIKSDMSSQLVVGYRLVAFYP